MADVGSLFEACDTKPTELGSDPCLLINLINYDCGSLINLIMIVVR